MDLVPISMPAHLPPPRGTWAAMLTGMPYVGWDCRLAAQVRRELQRRSRTEDWFAWAWGAYPQPYGIRASEIGTLAARHLGWPSPCVHPADDLRPLLLEPGPSLRVATFLVALGQRYPGVRLPEAILTSHIRQLVGWTIMSTPVPEDAEGGPTGGDMARRHVAERFIDAH